MEQQSETATDTKCKSALNCIQTLCESAVVDLSFYWLPANI